MNIPLRVASWDFGGGHFRLSMAHGVGLNLPLCVSRQPRTLGYLLLVLLKTV